MTDPSEKVTEARYHINLVYEEQTGMPTLNKWINNLIAAVRAEQQPFNTPCDRHKNTTHLVPGVPKGSECFGCYMEAVKRNARAEQLKETP